MEWPPKLYICYPAGEAEDRMLWCLRVVGLHGEGLLRDHTDWELPSGWVLDRPRHHFYTALTNIVPGVSSVEARSTAYRSIMAVTDAAMRLSLLWKCTRPPAYCLCLTRGIPLVAAYRRWFLRDQRSRGLVQRGPPCTHPTAASARYLQGRPPLYSSITSLS